MNSTHLDIHPFWVLTLLSLRNENYWKHFFGHERWMDIHSCSWNASILGWLTISISGKIAELHWYKDTASAAKIGLRSVKYIVMPKLFINVHYCPLVYLLCVDKAFSKVWYDANGSKPMSFWTAEFRLYPHRPHDNQLDKPIVVCCIFFPSLLYFLFLFRCIQTEDEQILKSMKSSINETLTNVAQHFGQLIELVLTHEAQVSL